MPGFISSIKAKLPAMPSIATKPSPAAPLTTDTPDVTTATDDVPQPETKTETAETLDEPSSIPGELPLERSTSELNPTDQNTSNTIEADPSNQTIDQNHLNPTNIEPTAQVSQPIVTDQEPTQASEPVITTSELNQVSQPVITTTEPSQVSEPVNTTPEPSQVSEPMNTTTEPTQVSEPAITTNEPSQVSEPVITTTEPTPAQLSQADLITPEPEPKPTTPIQISEPTTTTDEKVETHVIGPITGGEPGLSEPVPGLPDANPIEPQDSVPSQDTPAPELNSPSKADGPTVETEAALPTTTDPTPSSVSFPTATTTTTTPQAKEVPSGGMGRAIRLSIRRLGRSSEKVPSRKSNDGGRRSIDGSPLTNPTRKSMDVSESLPAMQEEEQERHETENATGTPDQEKRKVPLGDKLKGVYEEVKGRVKKNPEGVAYGKALRTGDLNV